MKGARSELLRRGSISQRPPLAPTTRRSAAFASTLLPAQSSFLSSNAGGPLPQALARPAGARVLFDFSKIRISADEDAEIGESALRQSPEAKLEIEAAEDPTEHEAGSVANQLMRAPDGDLASTPRYVVTSAPESRVPATAAPLILAGIAEQIGSEVVSLWTTYLFGGSSTVRDISADFAAGFTASPETATATRHLAQQLQAIPASDYAALLGSATSVTVDLSQRLAAPVAELDNPNSINVMEFVLGIPGNIAGGVGKDQKSIQIGAHPSPFDDAREASVTAKLSMLPGGAIQVAPSISFVVGDTEDLCPGECGAPPEQIATIPLSRFEATGLSGDVPYRVAFPGPSFEQLPFIANAGSGR